MPRTASHCLTQESQRNCTHSGRARFMEQYIIGILMEQEGVEHINGVNAVSGLLGRRAWPFQVNCDTIRIYFADM